MSASNPDQLMLEKVMEMGEIDVEMAQYVLDVMGIENTTKRKDFCQAGTMREWRRTTGIPNQDNYRAKLLSLGIYPKDVEMLLRFLLGTEAYEFPHEMRVQLDAYHRENGWADYLQCNARCTQCEFPCTTSAVFSDYKRLQLAKANAKKQKKQQKTHGRQNPVTFQEKLMQVLEIGNFEAMQMLDKMGLKTTVTWEQMKFPQFGSYWRQNVWEPGCARKLATLRLSPKKNDKLLDLLELNVHYYVHKVPVPDSVIINAFF